MAGDNSDLQRVLLRFIQNQNEGNEARMAHRLPPSHPPSYGRKEQDSDTIDDMIQRLEDAMEEAKQKSASQAQSSRYITQPTVPPAHSQLQNILAQFSQPSHQQQPALSKLLAQLSGSLSQSHSSRHSDHYASEASTSASLGRNDLTMLLNTLVSPKPKPLEQANQPSALETAFVEFLRSRLQATQKEAVSEPKPVLKLPVKKEEKLITPKKKDDDDFVRNWLLHKEKALKSEQKDQAEADSKRKDQPRRSTQKSDFTSPNDTEHRSHKQLPKQDASEGKRSRNCTRSPKKRRYSSSSSSSGSRRRRSGSRSSHRRRRSDSRDRRRYSSESSSSSRSSRSRSRYRRHRRSHSSSRDRSRSRSPRRKQSYSDRYRRSRSYSPDGGYRGRRPWRRPYRGRFPRSSYRPSLYPLAPYLSMKHKIRLPEDQATDDKEKSSRSRSRSPTESKYDDGGRTEGYRYSDRGSRRPWGRWPRRSRYSTQDMRLPRCAMDSIRQAKPFDEVKKKIYYSRDSPEPREKKKSKRVETDEPETRRSGSKDPPSRSASPKNILSLKKKHKSGEEEGDAKIPHVPSKWDEVPDSSTSPLRKGTSPSEGKKKHESSSKSGKSKHSKHSQDRKKPNRKEKSEARILSLELPIILSKLLRLGQSLREKSNRHRKSVIKNLGRLSEILPVKIEKEGDPTLEKYWASFAESCNQLTMIKEESKHTSDGAPGKGSRTYHMTEEWDNVSREVIASLWRLNRRIRNEEIDDPRQRPHWFEVDENATDDDLLMSESDNDDDDDELDRIFVTEEDGGLIIVSEEPEQSGADKR